MGSKEISQLFGKNIWLRKIGYFLIRLTTLREWYLHRAMKKILPNKEKPFRLLDAGSGMGQHAIAIAESYRNARVTGIELDSEQVQDCQDFALKIGLENVHFYKGDLTTFNYREEFDAIFCSSVLEHITDDTTVMRKLYKGLRENGSLIVYVPTSEKRVLVTLKRSMERQLKENNEKYPHQHVRYYSEEELVEKLEKTGFDILDSTITYGSFGRLAYDIVTTVQYSSFFLYIFPFYMMFIHPFVLLLMWADIYRKNENGNGLMILARKK